MEELNVNKVTEEPREEIKENELLSLKTVKEVFAAMAKENDGEFPMDAEKAALRFVELAPELVREARLADVFLACGGHCDLLAADNVADRKNAAEAVAKEMHREYWIDQAAADGICADFLGALGTEEAEEESLCQLADRYYSGDGVPQNKEKAAELYQEAAENGDIVAQYTLGYMYDKGDGIEKNRDAAVIWYEKAAENGHEAAQNRLGILKGQQDSAKPASEEAPKKKKSFFSRG